MKMTRAAMHVKAISAAQDLLYQLEQKTPSWEHCSVLDRIRCRVFGVDKPELIVDVGDATNLEKYSTIVIDCETAILLAKWIIENFESEIDPCN